MYKLGAFLFSYLACVISAWAADVAATPATWNGFARQDFEVAGHACLLISPATPAKGNPWIWRTEFFGVEPQTEIALLKAGWHVAFMNARDLYGAPPAMRLFEAFHRELVEHHGLNQKAVLEGLSRGGLYAYNFAVAHPDWVSGLYLDAPVLNIWSWPSPANKGLWKACLAAYGLTEDTAKSWRGPLDHVPELVQNGIPIMLVCGDADKTVPYPENGAILVERYRAAQGNIKLILKPGADHHPHSLHDPAPIVQFLLQYAQP